MRTKKWPGLDAPTEEYTDLCGPYANHTDVRGIDRLIGEGVVELPAECRDPLDILIAAEEPVSLLDEIAEELESIGSLQLPRRFHPTATARTIVWHAPGYEPRHHERRDPLGERMRQSRMIELRERNDLETLRALYSR